MYKSPIEVDEIKPYELGKSGRPTKIIAFFVGLFLIGLMVSAAFLGWVVVYVNWF